MHIHNVQSESTICFFFFQAEDGIRDTSVTGVQTCALPILAPEGRRRICPLGVNTYTLSGNRSTLTLSRNSSDEPASCSDTRFDSHSRGRSRCVESASPPVLDLQCAAMPASATRCMSPVRICTSIGTPLGPNRVVCSDW